MSNSVWDWSTTAGSNTLVGGVSIAEGMSPGNVNNAMRAIMAGLKDSAWGGTSAGTANAQTVSIGNAPSAYVAGMSITFMAGSTNTAAVTLNVNSLGAKNIFVNGAACVGGEIVSGTRQDVVYDGTQFQLQRSRRPVTLQDHLAVSGTSTTVTDIPPSATLVVMTLSQFSTAGTGIPEIRVGTSSGLASSGYTGSGGFILHNTLPGYANFTSGWGLSQAWAAAVTLSGSIAVWRQDAASDIWIAEGGFHREDIAGKHTTGGRVDLTDTLDRIAVVSAETQDNGRLSVFYM